MAPRIAEEASPSMSLQCLPSGCCAGPGSRAQRARTEAPEGHREDCGAGGASIQLEGLLVLYAPAGISCLLRLVGRAVVGWMDGWMERCAVPCSGVSRSLHALEV